VREPALTNVFGFTDQRERVARVPWFHVADLAGAFERARANDMIVGEMREGYFFARDPDGRVVGVRGWR
jgi:hypothetical protein